MKFLLFVEGESADELFAVGQKDLMNHFLPKYLGIKRHDVKACWFEEIKGDLLKGETCTITKHKDNLYRRKHKVNTSPGH